LATPIGIRGYVRIDNGDYSGRIDDLYTVPSGKRLYVEYIHASAYLQDPAGQMALELFEEDEGEYSKHTIAIPFRFQAHATWFIFIASEMVKMHFEPRTKLSARFSRDNRADDGGCSLRLWGTLEGTGLLPRPGTVVDDDPAPIERLRRPS
jgi:hypothetical protein